MNIQPLITGLRSRRLLRERGATVPVGSVLATMDEARRTTAEFAWRQTTAAGHLVSGAVLGAAFGQSDPWGTDRIVAVWTEPQS